MRYHHAICLIAEFLSPYGLSKHWNEGRYMFVLLTTVPPGLKLIGELTSEEIKGFITPELEG